MIDLIISIISKGIANLINFAAITITMALVIGLVIGYILRDNIYSITRLLIFLAIVIIGVVLLSGSFDEFNIDFPSFESFSFLSMTPSDVINVASPTPSAVVNSTNYIQPP